MAALKQMLERLNYTEVATLLNSGNAVFASSGRSGSKHAQHIAASLKQEFGVSTPVFVKSAAEFAMVIEQNPMSIPESEYSRFLVAFGQDAVALRSLEPLVPLANNPERLVITDHAAYLHCATGILESRVGAAMLGTAGKRVTTRNWATVLKIGTLLGVT